MLNKVSDRAFISEVMGLAQQAKKLVVQLNSLLAEPPPPD